MTAKRALLAVDVQNDFCDDGALPVQHGYLVARRVKAMLGDYAFLAASKDWHIDPGEHFDEWPVHCKAGTNGAELAAPLEATDFDVVVTKGQRAAAYSAFDRTGLADMLRKAGVTDLDVCGLATDYCVRQSALDARAEGFGVRLLLAATAGVAEDTTTAAIAEMREAGVLIDGFADNAEYLDNVVCAECDKGREESGKACDGCGVRDCTVTLFDCSYAPEADLCSDCMPEHRGCPECDPPDLGDR